MPGKPVVVFDGTCRICNSGVPWLRRLDWLKRFDSAPYQDPQLYLRFPKLKPEMCEQAMHLVFPDGHWYRGADAFRQIFLRMPLTFPLGLLLSIPPLPALFRKLYPFLARNRYRIGGRCDIAAHSSGLRIR